MVLAVEPSHAEDCDKYYILDTYYPDEILGVCQAADRVFARWRSILSPMLLGLEDKGVDWDRAIAQIPLSRSVMEFLANGVDNPDAGLTVLNTVGRAI